MLEMALSRSRSRVAASLADSGDFSGEVIFSTAFSDLGGMGLGVEIVLVGSPFVIEKRRAFVNRGVKGKRMWISFQTRLPAEVETKLAGLCQRMPLLI